MSAPTPPVVQAAALGGAALAAGTRVLARVRHAAKPLHPRGSVRLGRLRRLGTGSPLGVAWLDEPGDDEVLVRLSRSVGLPPPAPDVFGLAVRVSQPDGGHGDLLFSTTGVGRLSRFVLVPRRAASGGSMTTLLPYRTPAGPVLLAAHFLDETRAQLSWARGTGPWQRFGELSVGSPAAPDAPVQFDAVLNEVPGLATYEWVRALRAPSYRAARRSRGTD